MSAVPADEPDREPGTESRDDDGDDGADERFVVLASVCLFAVPAAITALDPYVDFPALAVQGSPLLVVAAPGLYWHFTRSEDNSSRTDVGDDSSRTDVGDDASATATAEPDAEAPRDGHEDTDDTAAQPDAPTPRSDLTSINYEMVSQQAMYRDQLLIRANYFSIAVIAVLVNIFLRTSHQFRPAVAMIGATTAYAFWLATESYKGSRDELNDELARLEDAHPDLSAVETYDNRDRSPVEKRSLSSYFVGLQIVATVLWTLVYLGYTGYLTYL